MDPETPDPTETDRALMRVDHGSPLPIFTGREMAHALTAYRELQRALDQAMPEQIMSLDGKPFRKKGYWQAIAVAFKLTMEPTTERREIASAFDDGRENFGYIVTYRATAPNGRSTTGDGSCFAIEKARKFRCPHPERKGSKRSLHFPAEMCPDFDPAFQWKTLPAQATEHNVRSHAHTRAFNRAVSNLVGFGEVSAEEVDVQGSSYTVEPLAPAPAVEGSPAIPDHVQPQYPERPADLPDGAVLIRRVEGPNGKAAGFVFTSVMGPNERGLPIYQPQLLEIATQACQGGLPVAVTTKMSANENVYVTGIARVKLPPVREPEPDDPLPLRDSMTADDIPF